MIEGWKGIWDIPYDNKLAFFHIFSKCLVFGVECQSFCPLVASNPFFLESCFWVSIPFRFTFFLRDMKRVPKEVNHETLAYFCVGWAQFHQFVLLSDSITEKKEDSLFFGAGSNLQVLTILLCSMSRMARPKMISLLSKVPWEAWNRSLDKAIRRAWNNQLDSWCRQLVQRLSSLFFNSIIYIFKTLVFSETFETVGEIRIGPDFSWILVPGTSKRFTVSASWRMCPIQKGTWVQLRSGDPGIMSCNCPISFEMGNCCDYLWITNNFSSFCVFHKISSMFYDFVLTSCGWLADAFSTRWGKNCLAIGPSGLWWTLLPSRSTRRRTWTQIHGEKECGWLQNDLKVLITTHHISEFHLSLTDSFQVLWTFYSFLCSLESQLTGLPVTSGKFGRGAACNRFFFGRPHMLQGFFFRNRCESIWSVDCFGAETIRRKTSKKKSRSMRSIGLTWLWLRKISSRSSHLVPALPSSVKAVVPVVETCSGQFCSRFSLFDMEDKGGIYIYIYRHTGPSDLLWLWLKLTKDVNENDMHQPGPTTLDQLPQEHHPCLRFASWMQMTIVTCLGHGAQIANDWSVHNFRGCGKDWKKCAHLLRAIPGSQIDASSWCYCILPGEKNFYQPDVPKGCNWSLPGSTLNFCWRVHPEDADRSLVLPTGPMSNYTCNKRVTVPHMVCMFQQ